MSKWKKIKPKQFVWLNMLTFFWWLAIVILFISYWWLKNANILYALIGLFIMGGLLIATTYYISRKLRYISKHIEHFVRVNNLYKSHIIKERGQFFGNEKEIEHYDYYPSIYYKEDGNHNAFCIKIRLDGSHITEALISLDKQLADMFKTACIDKIMERGYVIFKFELRPQKQLHILCDEDMPSSQQDEVNFSNNIIWNYKRCPHLLLTGITRSGKSTLCKYIIATLLNQNVRVIYCDPKADDDMRLFFHSHPIVKYVTELDEIVSVVRETEIELRARKKGLDKIGFEEFDFCPIFIFFDELLAFSKITDKKTFEEVKSKLSSITVMGASKRVYCALVTQRPDTTHIDGSTRDNLGCRIAMGDMSSTAYTMIFGEEFSKIKNTQNKIGSGLIFRYGVDTKPREFFAPYITQEAWKKSY